MRHGKVRIACARACTCAREPPQTITRGASCPPRVCKVFLPIMLKVYDGIFVAIVVNCCRKKFSAKVAIGSMALL